MVPDYGLRPRCYPMYPKPYTPYYGGFVFLVLVSVHRGCLHTLVSVHRGGGGCSLGMSTTNPKPETLKHPKTLKPETLNPTTLNPEPYHPGGDGVGNQGLIGEISFYAFGFEKGRHLAKKMVRGSALLVWGLGFRVIGFRI